MPKNLDYAALYYEAALNFLLAAKERFLPDHTETDPYDPINALLRITAARMHRDAALIDRAAEELFWPSFRTRAGAIALARLLGYRLQRQTPAQVDVVAQLQALITTPINLAPSGARANTLGSDEAPSVPFELDADLDSDKTGFDGESNDSGEVFHWDGSSYTDWNPAQSSDVYQGGSLGDATYFGHPDLMFTGLSLTLSSHAAVTGVWEYYDELFYFNPGPDGGGSNAAVQDAGGGVLEMRLDTYTGGLNMSDGAWTVEVRCLATGQTEECTVQWDAGNSRCMVQTSSYLGQSSPSTSPTAYEIRPLWVTLPGLIDGTTDANEPLEQDGDLTWELPQTRDSYSENARKWLKKTINGVTAYWLRLRRCGTAGAGSTQLDGASNASADNWWALLDMKQGQTVDEVIGQADGSSLQRYPLGSEDYAEGSLEVTVGGVLWSEVESLYTADPSDRSYQLVEDPDGTLVVEFGDGTNGLVPTGGGDIVASYRTKVATNGNVGAGSVESLEVASTLKNPTNPRAATGWDQREGHDDAGLERLRRIVPGWARVGQKIVTPEDAEYHAVRFKTDDDRTPIGRADAAEDVSDVQVITLWVLGPGGGSVTADDLEDLDEYLNGRTVGQQRIGGLMLSNQRVDPYVATLRTINATVNVNILSGYEGDADKLIAAAVREFLGPMALDSTGAFVHRVGGKVSYARFGSVVEKAITEGLSDYTYEFTGEASPLVSVDLGSGELPTPGTVTVNVTAVTSE